MFIFIEKEYFFWCVSDNVIIIVGMHMCEINGAEHQKNISMDHLRQDN